MRHNRQSGVTLMEMIVMLLFLAILVAGGAYNSATLVPSALEYHYALKIRSLLDSARDSAQTSGRSIYVNVTADGIATCWIADCPAGGGAAPVKDMFGDLVGFDMPRDLQTGGLPASVRFDNDGTASGWTPITVGATVFDIDTETGMVKK